MGVSPVPLLLRSPWLLRTRLEGFAGEEVGDDEGGFMGGGDTLWEGMDEAEDFMNHALEVVAVAGDGGRDEIEERMVIAGDEREIARDAPSEALGATENREY